MSHRLIMFSLATTCILSCDPNGSVGGGESVTAQQSALIGCTNGVPSVCPVGRSVFNAITDFGAAADGSTDDTNAVQCTIRSAVMCGSAAAPGGVAYFPRGTYKVTKQLPIDDGSSNPGVNVTIHGDGSASSLAFCHAGADGQYIGIYGLHTQGIVIRDLKIGPGGCTSNNGFNRGIVFSYGSDITIRDNDISGAIVGGFGYPSGIFLDQGVTRVQVSGNYMHDNGVNDGNSWHIVAYTSGGADNLKITGNRLMPGSSNGVNIGIGVFNSTYVDISGNHVEGILGTSANTNGYGIMLYGNTATASNRHTIVGNTVIDTGGTGIYVQNSPNTTVSANLLEDVAKTQSSVSLVVGGIGVNRGPVSVVGNVIRNVGVGNANYPSLRPSGISLEETADSDGTQRGSTIVGNTIEGAISEGTWYTYWGIRLSAPGDNTVIGQNTILNTAGGILVDGTSSAPVSNVSLSGNTILRTAPSGWTPADSIPGVFLSYTSNSTITGNSVTGAYGQGLVVYTGSNRNTVTGNVVRDSGVYSANSYDGIQISGQNNVVANNSSFNTGSTGQRYGMLEGPGPNLVQGNDFSHNQTGAMLSGGTGTQLYLNGASTYGALGSPADGALTYCSDCTTTNPCGGSGSGAFAKRLNGAWVCN